MAVDAQVFNALEVVKLLKMNTTQILRDYKDLANKVWKKEENDIMKDKTHCGN